MKQQFRRMADTAIYVFLQTITSAVLIATNFGIEQLMRLVLPPGPTLLGYPIDQIISNVFKITAIAILVSYTLSLIVRLTKDVLSIVRDADE